MSSEHLHPLKDVFHTDITLCCSKFFFIKEDQEKRFGSLHVVLPWVKNPF